jgi:hypothetical protein
MGCHHSLPGFFMCRPRERRTSDAEESRSNNQRSAAGYHASENDDLGAMGIAFPLCDGGVGSGHGMAQSSIPSAKLGQSSNCGVTESFASRQMLHLHGKKRLIDREGSCGSMNLSRRGT